MVRKNRNFQRLSDPWNPDMTESHFGFKSGMGGIHQRRTMMLDELRKTLEKVPSGAGPDSYRIEISDNNILSKPTQKARLLAFSDLKSLYALDPSVTLFRAMRRLWDGSGNAQALLGFCLALARDPFLRSTTEFILSKKPGDLVKTADMAAFLEERHGGRFSEASLKSFSQNLNGTWTQAGFLQGKVLKTRSLVEAPPVGVAYALFLAWLEGARGAQVFTSIWARLCGPSPEGVEKAANAAARQGLFLYRRVGDIIELGFDDWLTVTERGALS